MSKSLFNPIESDTTIPDEMFQKYIDIYDGRPKLAPVDLELMIEIESRFFESHTNVDKERLEKIWSFAQKMLQNNEALAQFVLDNGAAESDFFFPWVMSVATSPSEALELSYNAGRNLAGEWFPKIPKDDEINFFVHNLPTLAYNRERQLKVAELVMSDRCAVSATHKSKVLDLGAGRMAWARHHGFQFRPRAQEIIACDKDTAIKPAELFQKPLEQLGLIYNIKDINEQLADPTCMLASLVILQGVASYYPTEIFRDAILRRVYALLQRGGKFFFDLQLNHISYEWSVKVFGWPEMNLPKDTAEAIVLMEEMRKKLWEDGLRFKAEYALDTYHKSPLSVMVLLTKI